MTNLIQLAFTQMIEVIVSFYKHFSLQLLFAMDPALQPRARNLYEKFATNRVAEGHLMKALIKFYVG